MRTIFNSSTVVLLGISILVLPCVMTRADTDSPATRDILQQRIGTAKTGMDEAQAMYDKGLIKCEEMFIWAKRLLDARLDAAESETDRIAVLKEFVELAQSREKAADSRFRAGMVTHLDVEAAHYFRLDVELRLTRMTSGAGAGSESSPAKPTGTDKQSIQGTWKVVKKVKKGQPQDPDAEANILKFSGETVTLCQGDETKGQGTFKIDDSATPKRITLTGTTGQNAGSTFEAIYEIEGNTLKLAYSLAGNAGTPPKDFTGGKGEAMELLERQK